MKQYVVFEIGENAQDNFDIIDRAKPEDLWFHVQGFSSSHVIAKIANYDLDKKQVRQISVQGAVVCKQHSIYSHMTDLAIIYTKIKNIKKSSEVGKVFTRDVRVRII